MQTMQTEQTEQTEQTMQATRSRPTATALEGGSGRAEETSVAGRGGRSRSRHRVAVIGGDGIGPEVVAEALKVVAAAGVTLETTEYDLGADRYRRTGEVLPDKVLDELRGHDAILLGAVGPAVGDTSVPSGVLERGLLLRLRFELDLYVNLRPFHAVPGSVAAAAGGDSTVDFVVVRENTEGAYAGEGGFLRKGTPDEVATQGSVNTRMGVERVVRYAFELAEGRPARQVTLVHKTNVLNFSGDLWKRTFDAAAAAYRGIATGYQHVDAACIHMVERPAGYDVIVTDNLFGDILTDLAGAVCGGIGYAASANLHPGAVSMFEPVHGAAHDIAGTGRANPVAAVVSAALMLEHLGEPEAAARIRKAAEGLVEDATPTGAGGRPGAQSHTPATTTTAAIGDAIAERL